MAMGILLICNAGVGDTDLVVEKYQAGQVLTDLTNAAYLQSFETELNFIKSKTIEGAREFYGLEEGVRRYLSVYEKLLIQNY